ncbi:MULTISPECIES: flagellar basal body L-ring protein FlgH [unclassified Roseivivax]|uniref:flagellar basal body L-ring protein FlgH n=1 Tax=Roseivivax sp. GX 12232 TaxID=2900547 RepID=UPI001E3A3DC0|nr:flagellar basal body L-ring protein FlgH [Roseivivax sp. GX 12232]MCE0503895.1 flagellar basal body L-ring protein FlgH [Roseivivax sp. GX 12232]
MTFSPRLTAPLAALSLLSACSGGPLDMDPQPSQVGTGAQGAETVAVPMPPPEIQAPALRAERASLWEAGSGGFFADQRAEKVGDLLTIVIEIDDNARLKNETSRSRDGKTNFGTPSLFGFGKQLGSLLGDEEAAEDLEQADIVAVSGGQEVSGSGEIDRNERINLRVAALVVQQLPNGNLVVAGRQEVKVNQELRDLRVSGIIRPADIQRDNSISYDKIAEARVTYGGQGQLSKQQRIGYGEGLMDVILPY